MSTFASPPQGDLLGGILNFIGTQRQMQMVDEQRQRAMATNALLGQQMGLPPNVDAFGVQKFQTGESDLMTADSQRQSAALQRAISQATEQRTAQDFAGRNEFANNVNNYAAQNLGNSTNPMVQIGRQGGMNPYAADLIVKAITGETGNQQQTALQQSLETIRTQGANQRNQDALAAQAQAAALERTNKQADQSRLAGEIAQAYAEAQKTGDFSKVVGFAPELLGSQAFQFLQEGTQTRVSDEKKRQREEEERAKRIEGLGGEGGASAQNANFSPEQLNQIALARIQGSYLNGMAPEAQAATVIRETEGIGPSHLWRAVKQAYPEIYDKVWNQRQKEKAQEEYQKALSRAKNPILDRIFNSALPKG
jgi:hypothetical protein